MSNNLPTQLTSFVGRESELRSARDRLASTRLLALTGAGGCGKTRLAAQLAADVLNEFPDGTWWVELAPLAEDQLVAGTIAQALGVRPLPGMSPLQAVCANLSQRHALVILDNCEHVLEPCAEVTEAILHEATGVSVLATSRTPLGVTGETDWLVPSMSLPETDAVASVDLPSRSDAVCLFVERARTARRSFVLTEENASGVVEICRELDGIPLAIELAAARIRMLSVEQIVAQLAQRFRLLTGGEISALPRQQRLRASVDWSHDLLDERERILFRRLGVFAGGFSLETAERVCPDKELPSDQILDLLTSLIDSSLVVIDEWGAAVRYRLLETIRHYALERLDDAAEVDALRTRHRDYFLAVAEEARPHLETARQREWLEKLDPEGANLAAAIDHAIATSPERALRFCAALFMWWRARVSLADAEAAYSRAVAVSEAVPASLRGTVFWGRAYIALGAGEFEAAEDHASEALALARDAGDKATAARALTALGLSEAWARPALARPGLLRSAELAREAGDPWALVNALQFVAITYLFQDEHDQVVRFCDEAADVGSEHAELDQVARGILLVASADLLDGRLSKARETVERTLAAEDVIPDPAVEGWLQAQLGLHDVLTGEFESAFARLQSRLTHAIEFGAGMAIPALLTWTAWAELAMGRPADARQRLEGTISIVEGRDSLLDVWCRWLLAECLRLLGAEDADAEAERARKAGVQMGNLLAATRGRYTLGRLAAARGEWAVAEKHILAHLDVVAEGGHASFIPHCFDALAEVAAGLGSDEEAVRLFAVAARARSESGIARWAREEEHWDAIDGRLRAALGNAAYDRAWAEGGELATEEAIAWARRARGARKRPPGGWESLTPTELQVAKLATEGLTNPQIGERMFISRATVKVHLAHIYRKLDVRNRAELAAAAARREG